MIEPEIEPVSGGALPTQTERMHADWAHGDLRKADALVSGLKTKSPDTYAKMVLGCNRDWMPRFDSMLRASKPSLAVLGFFHMASLDVLLVQLRALGWTLGALGARWVRGHGCGELIGPGRHQGLPPNRGHQTELEDDGDEVDATLRILICARPSVRTDFNSLASPCAGLAKKRGAESLLKSSA